MILDTLIGIVAVPLQTVIRRMGGASWWVSYLFHTGMSVWFIWDTVSIWRCRPPRSVHRWTECIIIKGGGPINYSLLDTTEGDWGSLTGGCLSVFVFDSKDWPNEQGELASHTLCADKALYLCICVYLMYGMMRSGDQWGFLLVAG